MIKTADTPLMTNDKFVLYKKNFEDLQTFEWNDVVTKRIERQSTLENILLAVMCRNKVLPLNVCAKG